MTTQVLPLDDPRASDPEEAGHKAATLAGLRHGGWNVPDGFVVSPGACAESAESGVGQVLRTEVERHLKQIGGPVAVRSSAVAEDLPGASFAGQYESYLSVENLDETCHAIAACAASAKSERARSYRRRHGETRSDIAVLVQAMVPADFAGIAFSANPVTGDREETVINAVSGLGDRLAAGEATPDEWVVRDGTVECLHPSEDSIDEDLVGRIALMAETLERELGSPQDVEWAVAGDDIYLLQSRPITALPVEPDLEIPDEGTWTKDVAHYPEPVSPLGASIYLPALDAGIRNMCSEFGLFVDGVTNTSLGGEIYGRVMPAGGKDGPPPPWWLMGVLSRVVPPLRAKVKAARNVFESGTLEELPRRWKDEWRNEFSSEIEKRRSIDLEALSDDALIDELAEAERLLEKGQLIHFRLFIPHVVGVYGLAKAARRILGWNTDQTMRLLSGLSEASSEPARELEKLARRIRETPGAVEAVNRAGADVAEAVGSVDRSLGEAIDEYREFHGFRAIGYDPGSPTLGERPGVLARQLKEAVKSAPEGGDPGSVRANAEDEASEILDNLDKSRQREFTAALARARDVYGLREDNIVWTDNVPNAVIRRVTLEIGRRLVDRGQLTAKHEVSYLTREELVTALRGDDDMIHVAERRRAEQKWVEAHPGPPFHGPQPTPPPDLRAVPAEARRINEAFLWFMGHEYDTTPVEGDGMAGAPGSPGTYTGPVRVIRSEAEFEKLSRGDVLVCRVTTPVWSVLFGTAGAVVTDGGGALSHAAIVAREHGIPAVLGTAVATRELTDGQEVVVDGTRGMVTPVES